MRSADGTMLHAEVHGPEDAPTVVFSHGWTCSTLVWLPILRVLGDSIRAVLYDQRGHGRSETPRRSGYSTTALADDLCAVLHATVPRGTRVAVVGHSMGGMTLMAAADRPEFRSRVAAALLASTGSHELVPGAHVVGGPSLLRSAFHRMLLTAPLPLGPITPLTRAGLRYVTMSPGSSPEMVVLCVRMVHACRRAPRPLGRSSATSTCPLPCPASTSPPVSSWGPPTGSPRLSTPADSPRPSPPARSSPCCPASAT